MPYGRITPKQQEILDYIKNEILNRGFPPAVREICEAVNLKSTSSVHSHLEALEKNGYIRRDATGKTVGGVFRYNSIFFVLIKYFNTAKNRIAFINTVYSLQGICLSDHIFFTGIRIDQGIPFLK